jgi:hypothetical protein
MRKAFWALTLLTAYIWTVSTGHEQWILDQGKKLYQVIVAWFSDAEVDFQVEQSVVENKKKRPRRWD